MKYGGINAFNALMTEKRRHHSLADVLLRHDEIHERLIEYIGGVPDELLARESLFRRQLRLDTYGHDPIHATAIRKWRQGSIE